MVIGALAPALGHLARIGVTSTSARSAAGTFAQSLPFGAGYSFGTYIGFPKNYQSNNYNKTKVFYLSKKMPYGRRSYSRYNRRPSYGAGKVRVWSKKYRRYIYVYPRRRY